MSGLTPEQRQEFFRLAVQSVVGNWTALQMMVDNSGVGPAFVPWLVDATVQWFKDNRDLQYEEAEGFFEDIVINEFYVSVEDGSLREVGRKVCQLYRLCSNAGRYTVEDKIKALPGISDREANMVVDSEWGNVAGAAPPRPGERIPGLQSEEGAEQAPRRVPRPKPETDEDGWTTVPTTSRGKKPRQKQVHDQSDNAKAGGSEGASEAQQQQHIPGLIDGAKGRGIEELAEETSKLAIRPKPETDEDRWTTVTSGKRK